MDGESAIGMYFLNNHSYSSNPVNRGHNYGVINMSGNNAIGMLSTGGQVYNMNTIISTLIKVELEYMLQLEQLHNPQFFRYLEVILVQ